MKTTTTIYTETSIYFLDRCNKRIKRVPCFEKLIEPPAYGVPVITANLQKDSEETVLRELLECEIGKPMQMLIDLHGDGILTFRTTTKVKAIIDYN